MMRYLTIAADYTESALRDDYTGSIIPEEVGLPTAVGDRLRSWNARYRRVIPLDPDERAVQSVMDTITSLDEEGLALVREIMTIKPDFKVRYYSEGLLKHLA